jgi:hypothetical protein
LAVAVTLGSCLSFGTKSRHRNELTLDDLTSAPTVDYSASLAQPILRDVTFDKLAMLPPDVRSAPELASIAVGYDLARPILYDLGVYGKVGNSTVFVTTRDRIADWDRLYWVMVRVLSEKYGCFITRRESRNNESRFTCRDGRSVVLKRQILDRMIYFYGRQYDREGRELIVQNRKVIARLPIE